MSIFTNSTEALKDFRVFVTSLRPPYTAAFTTYYAHPDFACAAAVQFGIFPPLWIGCLSERPQPLAAQLVESALERFTERFVDSSVRRVPTTLRVQPLKKTPGRRTVGRSDSRATLHYMFLEFA